MNFRHQLLFFTVALSCLPIKADPKNKCKASHELDANKVNPAKIQLYLKANQLNDMGDFICCLPKEYRENYVIAHSSISAQSSHYQSPRILFFNDLSSESKLKSVISVNGGATDLPRTNNIEILDADSESRKSELSDLELTPKGPRFSGINPNECMGCHGGFPESGPREPHPNFDPFGSWGRFKNGLQDFCSDTHKDYHENLDQKVTESLSKNPRFRCLEKQKYQNFNLLSRLDGELSKLNSRRLANIIRATPEYGRFQFAILGAQICSVNAGSKSFEVTEWVPPGILSQLTDDRTLSRPLRSPLSLENGVATELAKRRKEEEQVEKHQVKEIDKMKKNLVFQGLFQPVNLVNGCYKDMKTKDLVGLATSKNDLFNRYILDRKISGSNDGALRFLFEARGIDTGSWEMSARHGDYRRSLEDTTSELLLYANSPDLVSIRNDLFKAGLILDKNGNPNKEVSQKMSIEALAKLRDETRAKSCGILKKRSMEAFNNMSSSKQHDQSPASGIPWDRASDTFH